MNPSFLHTAKLPVEFHAFDLTTQQGSGQLTAIHHWHVALCRKTGAWDAVNSVHVLHTVALPVWSAQVLEHLQVLRLSQGLSTFLWRLPNRNKRRTHWGKTKLHCISILSRIWSRRHTSNYMSTKSTIWHSLFYWQKKMKIFLHSFNFRGHQNWARLSKNMPSMTKKDLAWKSNVMLKQFLFLFSKTPLIFVFWSQLRRFQMPNKKIYCLRKSLGVQERQNNEHRLPYLLGFPLSQSLDHLIDDSLAAVAYQAAG